MFLLDIALGLAIATDIAIFGKFEPSLWFLVAGVLGSIVPDVDMIIYLLRGGKLDKFAHKHRDISHYPILTMPVATWITNYFFGYQYATIIASTLTMHYVTDSLSIGWGIRWLYPFSRRYFAYQKTGYGKTKFHAWTPEEQEKAASEHGNNCWATDKRQWVRDLCILGLSVVLAIAWYI